MKTPQFEDMDRRYSSKKYIKQSGCQKANKQYAFATFNCSITLNTRLLCKRQQYMQLITDKAMKNATDL